MRFRSSGTRARIAFAFAGCMLLTMTVSPGAAVADLADDISDAFTQALNELWGDEGETSGFDIEVESLPLTCTFLGFAFCEPPDRWAEPLAVPVPPYNIYDCQNYSTATTDVSLDETSATVTITISRVFLDLETTRERGILCSVYGDGPPNYILYPPTGYTGHAVHDGYLFCTVSFSVGIELVQMGGCFHCSLVPGSLDLVVTPDIFLSEDECLNAYWSAPLPGGGTIADMVWPEVQSALDNDAEVLVNGAMTQISATLCQSTPAGDISWGAIKCTYRSGSGGDAGP